MSYKTLFSKIYTKIKDIGHKAYETVKDVSSKINNVFHKIDHYYDIARSLPIAKELIDLTAATPVGQEVRAVYQGLRGVSQQFNNVLNPQMDLGLD
jgi:hypothetical protein